MGDPGSRARRERPGGRSWCLRRVGMDAEWLLLEDGSEVRGPRGRRRGAGDEWEAAGAGRGGAGLGRETGLRCVRLRGKRGPEGGRAGGEPGAQAGRSGQVGAEDVRTRWAWGKEATSGGRAAPVWVARSPARAAEP